MSHSNRKLDLRLSVLISRLYLRSGQVVGFVTFHYVKRPAALKNGIIRRVRKPLYTFKSFNLMNSLILECQEMYISSGREDTLSGDAQPSSILSNPKDVSRSIYSSLL